MDLEGYWRDIVLKDLVKHAVQVAIGVLVLSGFGIIGPDHYQWRALAVAAGIGAVASAAYLFLPFALAAAEPWPHRRLALLAALLSLFALDRLASPARLPADLARIAAVVILLCVTAAVLRWVWRRARRRNPTPPDGHVEAPSGPVVSNGVSNDS